MCEARPEMIDHNVVPMHSEPRMDLAYDQLRNGQTWIDSWHMIPLMRDFDRRLSELEE